VKGVFEIDGTTYNASASAVLTPYNPIGEFGEFDAYLYVMFPAKAGKFPGYCWCHKLHWNGEKFSVKK